MFVRHAYTCLRALNCVGTLVISCSTSNAAAEESGAKRKKSLKVYATSSLYLSLPSELIGDALLVKSLTLYVC